MVVVASVTLALSASAATAIVLTSRRSAPLSGRLPGQLLGSRYTLQVTPDLRAGQAGWCITLRDLRSGTSISLGPTQCVTGQGPLIAHGGYATVSPTTGRVGGWLLYAITTPPIATLRAPDGSRIQPMTSPRLPAGWRAAVTIQTNPRSHTTATLVPLNRNGGVVDAHPTADTQTALPTRTVDPHHPPRVGCRIDAQPLSGLRLLHARAIREAPSRSLQARPAFLSCYTLTYRRQGRAGTAAILLDGRHAGATPAPIPGTTQLRGHPGDWGGPATPSGGIPADVRERLVARRFKDGWLTVESPAATPLVLRLLDRLRPEVAGEFSGSGKRASRGQA